jgi:hypothetical protein
VQTGGQSFTARIKRIESDDSGARLAIAWSEAQNNGTEDALDLAWRCVAAWAKYLRGNGLQSPI